MYVALRLNPALGNPRHQITGRDAHKDPQQRGAGMADADEMAASAIVTRITACQLSHMMPCFLTKPRRPVLSAGTRRPAVVPSVLTSGQAALLQRRQFCHSAGSGALTRCRPMAVCCEPVGWHRSS